MNNDARKAPWGLGGEMIDIGNCIAAYQPKGAASLAESYQNLAAPGWDATDGWTFSGAMLNYPSNEWRCAYCHQVNTAAMLFCGQHENYGCGAPRP